MPITTNVDNKKGLRTHTVTGLLVPDELKELLKQVYDSPQYDTEMNVLWDLRHADLSLFSTHEITRLRSFVSDKWGTAGTSRAALVVSSDLDYGLSRMYEMLSDGRTKSMIRAFRDRNEAMEWITPL